MTLCGEPECSKPLYGRGMCSMHYTRWRKTQMPPCRQPECGKPSVNHKTGLCAAHYDLLRRHGTPEKLPVLTVEDRFWSHVQKTETCWLWTGAAIKGYGVFAVSHDDQVYAHRFGFVLQGGEIPPGTFLDHVRARGCTSTLCVRRDHLEPVSTAENNRRSAALITACPQDHPYDEENTRRDKHGYRHCRTCEKKNWQRQNARRKAARRHAASPPS